MQAGHDDKVALAHEELRQLNLKKLQFLLRQEHRNADAVRCGMVADQPCAHWYSYGHSTSRPAAAWPYMSHLLNGGVRCACRRLMELVNSLCYFFRMLPKSLQSEVCAVMKLETYVRNEIVFTMGDAPDKFYIIASGKVRAVHLTWTSLWVVWPHL